MTDDQREIRRKLRILEHAESSGDVSKTCRYFGIGRAGWFGGEATIPGQCSCQQR